MIKFMKRRGDLRRYKKWRERQVKLNSKMTKGLSKDILLEAAKDLRMLKNDIIIFDSEYDSSYLNDRAIYDIKVHGKRGVEVFFEKNNEFLSHDEKKLLNAMKDSKYSLFIVEDIRHDQGLYLTDAFSKEKLFLSDINMSYSIKAGCLLSLRVISLDGINLSSGASCVFENECLKQLMNNFVDLYERKRHMMTWDKMRREYNPYFLKMMKQSDKKITFSNI